MTLTNVAPHPERQRGVTLAVSLIVLVALTVAGIALVRSVDTGNVIAGNFAFRQAALQATDAGIEAAFSQLPGIISTSLETPIANQYYPLMQPLDEDGIPTTVNWSAVPSRELSGYTVRYVIERLCSGSLPVTDIQNNCVVDQAPNSGSKKQGSPVFSAANMVNYRVTVRVEGPRNTLSLTQAILAF
jgi:type IV pilus assembly protein PilX